MVQSKQIVDGRPQRRIDRSVSLLDAVAAVSVAALLLGGFAQPAFAQAAAADHGGAAVVELGDLDLSMVQQEWGKPGKNTNVDNGPLTIAGKRYAHGVGSHATSRIDLDVNGAVRFTATVGLDDASDNARAAGNDEQASVEFVLVGDGKQLFRSGVMRKGDVKQIDVPLAGVKRLSLTLTDAGNGITYDHGNWADAKFEYVGKPPTVIDYQKVAAEELAKAPVLTPKPKPEPRINGARVFGARPGSPILLTIPCTGERPITFAIDGQLPAGLTFDAKNGRITGSVEQEGEYAFTIKASNARGEASRQWKLVVDDAPGTLAKTPPMGWNSWNVWGMAIDDAKVRAAADAFVSTGLIDHGWTYINIDDGWAYRDRNASDEAFRGDPRDRDGNVRSNPKFPDMKALTDYVHGKGLKVGLYSSPGPRTCGDVEGSLGYEDLDAKRYADWGFDYLKYDQCSYGGVIERERKRLPDNRTLHMRPYEVMRDQLRKQKRDIIYSLCQYGIENVSSWGHEVDGQLWRTTGDINDSWSSMSGIGFGQNDLAKYAKPGNWNDPDMLVVGYVGWGPNVRPSKLTPDEQYTHVSLWALLSAPLLIGCDLTKLDPFTLGLLTNDEVIDVNQDALGKQATRVQDDGDHEVWAKPLEDGSVAVGLFNRASEGGDITVKFSALPLAGDKAGALDVRDIWRQQPLGEFNGEFKATVPSHGVVLVRVGKAPAKP